MIKTRDETVAVAGWPECVTSLAYTPGLMDNGLAFFILLLILELLYPLFHVTSFRRWYRM